MRVGVGRGWLAGVSDGRIWPRGAEIRGGGEQVEEREMKEVGGKGEREKERKGRKKSEKNFSVFGSGFPKPDLYFSKYFGMKFRVDVFLVVLTIFNKHDNKMGFQPNIFGLTV